MTISILHTFLILSAPSMIEFFKTLKNCLNWLSRWYSFIQYIFQVNVMYKQTNHVFLMSWHGKGSIKFPIVMEASRLELGCDNDFCYWSRILFLALWRDQHQVRVNLNRLWWIISPKNCLAEITNGNVLQSKRNCNWRSGSLQYK